MLVYIRRSLVQILPGVVGSEDARDARSLWCTCSWTLSLHGSLALVGARVLITAVRCNYATACGRGGSHIMGGLWLIETHDDVAERQGN